MAQQTVGIGTSANDGTGDPLRTAYNKINSNFTELYARGAYEGGPSTTVPLVSALTWANQGTSTATDGTGALVLTPQLNGVSHALYKAVPTAPYDIYCRVDHTFLSNSLTSLDTGSGIFLRDSADSECIGFYAGFESTTNLTNIRAIRWTANGATYSADIFPTSVWTFTGQSIKWLRVNVTSTTITFYYSADGKNWHAHPTTEPLSSFIDAVTHYGVSSYGNSGLLHAKGTFSYLSTTAPA